MNMYWNVCMILLRTAHLEPTWIRWMSDQVNVHVQTVGQVSDYWQDQQD